MHKGIATVSVSGTLENKLKAISAAKFDGIEALPKRVQVMAADVDAIKRLIASHCD